MNEKLTEGTMPYYSSEQIRGEIRFVVEGDEIIKNQDDWNALPETDENTINDFYRTAELMLQNWGHHYGSYE